MATGPYQHGNWAEPVDTDTGPNVPLKANKNLKALRDGLLFGKVKDWQFERVNGTGSADQPQFWRWKNTVTNVWFRSTNTWTGNKITAQLVEWSEDAGASWVTVHAGDAITYDGNLNITSQTIGSGIYVLVLELIAKCYNVIANLATHIAGTGAAVHGLGTMSTQAKTAVDIDGGTIDGTPTGDTTRARGSFTRVAEDLNTLAPGAGAGVLVDWAYGGTQITNSGTNLASFANIPAGVAGHLVYVSNFNSQTWPGLVDWGAGGKPSINGAASIVLTTLNGGTAIRGSVAWQAV